MMSKPIPTEIKLHQKSRELAVAFDDGSRYQFSCEFLRVFSPSAEVRGHGVENAVLQVGKENVSIIQIEPVGQYAVKLYFDDGHHSGIYSWDYLKEIGEQQGKLWQQYLQRLEAAGHTRQTEQL
jgi:DUF971 family protein